jgi:fructosamine-3-kinase
MKYTSLAEAVRSICGQERIITGKSPVFGGDINEAFRLTLDDGTSLFMKSNAPDLLPAFEAEEAGLQAIAGTGAIGTVRVLGIGTDPGGFSFLLLE